MKKVVDNGYILAVSELGEGITVEEYKSILNAIDNKPDAPIGYSYRLRENLEWELVKIEEGGL